MFAYASSLGMALLNNMTLVLFPSPYTSLLFQTFDLRAKVDWDLEICGDSCPRDERACCAFSERLMNLGKVCGRVQMVHGYLQSWRYFQHAETEVRKEFQFKATIRAQSERLLYRLRRGAATNTTANQTDDARAIEKHPSPDSRDMSYASLTLIGVHVRHKDITTQEHFVKHGYQVPNMSYYQNAMQLFSARFPNILFVVATDHREYVKDEVMPLCRAMNARCHMINNAAWVDLAVLAGCDHVVMSVGSFGWWAAWLAGGQVVYYKHPAREGSRLKHNINHNDYFPPEWIGLE
nr:hypothetical protein BaRGS_032177 [Batillaria attramentaria]